MDFQQLSKKCTLSRLRQSGRRIWIGDYPSVGDVIMTIDGTSTAVIVGEPEAIGFRTTTNGDPTGVTVRQEIITASPRAFRCFDGKYVLYSFLWSSWETRYVIIRESVPKYKGLEYFKHKLGDTIVNIAETMDDFFENKVSDNL